MALPQGPQDSWNEFEYIGLGQYIIFQIWFFKDTLNFINDVLSNKGFSKDCPNYLKVMAS